MEKQKIKSLIIILIFTLFIGTVAIGTLISAPHKDYLEDEKRFTAAMPEFSADALLDASYLTAFEEYIEDRILGRSFFVGSNAYLHLASGGNILENIYYCKEGYLINAPKALNEKTVCNNISRFEEFSREINLPSKMIIVPSPGYIMESILPDKAADYCDDYIFSVAEDSLSHTKLIDVRDSFKNSFESGEALYYKTDHHLTSLGSYDLYSILMKASDITPREKNSFKVEVLEDFCGTTRASSGYFLSKGDSIELWHSGEELCVSVSNGKEYEKAQDDFFFREHLEKDDKYPVFADGNHALTRIENNGNKGKNLLIIKDSYAHCLAGFLSSEYQNIYMIDLRYYRFPVSEFIMQNKIDELLFVYGADSINTDTNSGWLY